MEEQEGGLGGRRRQRESGKNKSWISEPKNGGVRRGLRGSRRQWLNLGKTKVESRNQKMEEQEGV